MKMNFLGLHTYPYSAAGGGHATGSDEPTVFVGTLDDLEADGSVKTSAAYPTSYANTMRGEWGYAPMATSDYSWGTSALFESDCWAPEPTTVDVCPYPTTQEGSAEFFERTSTMLSEAFTHAKALGVQSCVGTETPLSKPEAVGPKCSVKGEAKCFKDSAQRILPHVVTGLRLETAEVEHRGSHVALLERQARTRERQAAGRSWVRQHITGQLEPHAELLCGGVHAVEPAKLASPDDYSQDILAHRDPVDGMMPCLCGRVHGSGGVAHVCASAQLDRLVHQLGARRHENDSLMLGVAYGVPQRTGLFQCVHQHGVVASRKVDVPRQFAGTMLIVGQHPVAEAAAAGAKIVVVLVVDGASGRAQRRREERGDGS